MMKKVLALMLLMILLLTGCNKCKDQKTLTINDGTTTTAPSTYAETALNFPKNHIVKTPAYGKITTEISQELIGKYVGDCPENYFEIKTDGTVCVSQAICEGYEMFDSDRLLLLTRYNTDYTFLSFIIVRGESLFSYAQMALEFSSYTNIESGKFNEVFIKQDMSPDVEYYKKQ